MKRLILSLTLLIFLISLPCLCFGITYYVTPTGLGNKQGSNPANAMDIPHFVDATTSGTSAIPDTWFFLAGNSTYAGVTNIGQNVEDGSTTQPIMIAGITPFDTTSTDQGYAGWPNNITSGASRPFIQLDANQVLVDDYWQLHGLMIEGTSDPVVDMDIGSLISGCSIYNVTDQNVRECVIVINYSTVYNSRFATSSGFANTVTLNGNYGRCMYSYIHDSHNGLIASNCLGAVVVFNIFDTISGDALTQSQPFMTAIQNTFLDCKDGINSDKDDPGTFFLSNNFDNCTTSAIDSEGNCLSRVIDYNNYFGAGSVILDGDGNGQKGIHATAFDPNFTNFVPDASSGVTSGGKAMKDPYGAGE